jgi:hypothetical protein
MMQFPASLSESLQLVLHVSCMLLCKKAFSHAYCYAKRLFLSEKISQGLLEGRNHICTEIEYRDYFPP